MLGDNTQIPGMKLVVNRYLNAECFTGPDRAQVALNICMFLVICTLGCQEVKERQQQLE